MIESKVKNVLILGLLITLLHSQATLGAVLTKRNLLTLSTEIVPERTLNNNQNDEFRSRLCPTICARFGDGRGFCTCEKVTTPRALIPEPPVFEKLREIFYNEDFRSQICPKLCAMNEGGSLCNCDKNPLG